MEKFTSSSSSYSSSTGPARPGRVVMWTTPRSVSTAITLSMSQIPEVAVWCHSYRNAHLGLINMKQVEGIDMPNGYRGHEAIYRRAATLVGRLISAKMTPSIMSYANIQSQMEQEPAEYVFVKDMAVALGRKHLREFLPRGYRHSFLIRHPVLTFQSMHKTYFKQFLEAGILDPCETDEKSFDLRRHEEMAIPGEFYTTLYDLWKFVKEEVDPDVVIIDSSDVLANPSGVLSRYCGSVGLPYSEAQLRWTAPGRGMPSSWKGLPDFEGSQTFVDTMCKSVGFKAPQPPLPRDQLTDDVIALSDAAMPLYEEMYRCRITGKENIIMK